MAVLHYIQRNEIQLSIFHSIMVRIFNSATCPWFVYFFAKCKRMTLVQTHACCPLENRSYKVTVSKASNQDFEELNSSITSFITDLTVWFNIEKLRFFSWDGKQYFLRALNFADELYTQTPSNLPMLHHSNASSWPRKTNSHPTPFIFDHALSLISDLHHISTED